MSNDIQEKIDQARQAARAACETNGAESAECAVEWDTVEELQSEAAHRKQKVTKNSLDKYCDDNPDALECRVYDN
jgi:L-lactate utilization protein LutB